MSDSDESDVMPELRDSDSESEEDDDWEDLATNNDECARFWFNKNRDIAEHHRVIKIYALGPFLYGVVDQPQHWITFLSQVGLIKKTLSFNIEPLKQQAIDMLDIMENAVDVVIKGIDNGLEPGTRHQTLKDILDFIELADKHSAKGMDEIIRSSCGKSFIRKWLFKVEAPPTVQNKNDKIVVALLFACQQYARHVWELTKENKNRLRDFEDSKRLDDKRMPEKKQLGNEEFKKGNYSKAISLYTNGLYISPFCLLLYSNRAQSYLRSGNLRGAMCDGRRCIVLNPQWAKGHFRYAQALLEMGKLTTVQKAQNVLKNALLHCPTDKTLLVHKQREVEDTIRKMLNKEELKKSQEMQENKGKSGKENVKKQGLKTNCETEDDDCPELTSSSDDDPKQPKSKSKKRTRKLPQRKSSIEEPHESESEDEDKHCTATCGKKAAPETLTKNRTQKNTQKEMADRLDEKTKELQRNLEKKVAKASTKVKEVPPSAESEKACIQSELETNMRQGSEAYLEQKCRNAVWYYHKAIDLVKQYTLEYFESIEEVDYIVLMYAMGNACVDTGMQREIVIGIDWFTDIIENHKSVRFPLAYLGLGKAYHKQNRFSEALQPLEKGLLIVTRIDMQPSVLTWPMSTQAIEDSRADNLKSAFESLMVRCKYPPPPDAICKYQHCTKHYSMRIYLSDPDFKGFIRLTCFAKCVLEYHVDCWKLVRSTGEGKLSDREILAGKLCFTPDCNSLVAKIIVFDHDGQKQKEMAYEGDPALLNHKLPKKHIKMKPTSQKAIKRKEERKALRLQKKAEVNKKETDKAGTSGLALIEEIESASVRDHKSADHFEEIANDVNFDKCVTVLHKGQVSPEQMYKPKNVSKSKKRRKREHSKVNALSLQEFVGHTDSDEHSSTPTPVGSNTSLADPNYPVLDPKNPFAVPQGLIEEIQAFERSTSNGAISSCTTPLYATSTTPTYTAPVPRSPYAEVAKKSPDRSPPKEQPQNESDLKTLDIKETLFSFFAGMLQENGPLRVDDPVIQRELEEFPEEAKSLIDSAGGVGRFLTHSLQFAMIEEFVCLMQDAVKARGKADEYRRPLLQKYREQIQKNEATKNNKKLSPSQFPPVGTMSHVRGHSSSTESVHSAGSREAAASSASDSGIAKTKLSFTTIASSVLSGHNAPPSPVRAGHSSANTTTPAHTVTTDSPKHGQSVTTPKAGKSKKHKKHKKSPSSRVATASVSDSDINKNVNNLQEKLDTSSLMEFAEACQRVQENTPPTPANVCLPPAKVAAAASIPVEEEGCSGASEKGQPAASVGEQFRRQVFAAMGRDPLQVVERENRRSSASPASVTSEESLPAEDPLVSKPGQDRPFVVKRPTAYNTVAGEIYKFSQANGTKVVARRRGGNSAQASPVTRVQQEIVVPPRSGSVPPVSSSSQEAEQLRKLDQVKDLWQEGQDRDKGKHIASRPWGDEVKRHFTPPEQRQQNTELMGDSRAGEQGQSPEDFSTPFIQTGTSYAWSRDSSPRTPRAITPGDSAQGEPGPLWPSYAMSPVSPGHVARVPPGMASSRRELLHQTPPSPKPTLNCMPSIHSGVALVTPIAPYVPNQSSLLGSGIHIDPKNGEEGGDVDIWDMDNNRPDPTVDPLVLEKDCLGAAESTALQIKRLDEEFCREQAKLVCESWKKYPEFSQNPSLMDKAMDLIKTDLFRASARDRVPNSPKHHLPIGSPSTGKNKHKTKGTQCHITVAMVDSVVNTDPCDNPYREQLEMACHNAMLLQQRIQQEMDKNVQMSNITSTEINSLQKHRDDLLVDCQNFEQFNQNMAKDFESESKKWGNEKKKYLEEIKSLKLLQKGTEVQAEQANSRALECERRFIEVNDRLNQQREEMTKERVDLQMKVEHYEQRLTTELSRAESAEVSLLQLKMEVGMQILDRSLKDAEMYATQLGSQVRKIQSEKKQVPQPLHVIFTKWVDTAQEIKRRKTETVAQFEEYIRRVRQGESLSNLPPIPIPQPPPAPEFPFGQIGASQVRQPVVKPPGVPVQQGFSAAVGTMPSASPHPQASSPHPVFPTQTPPTSSAFARLPNGGPGFSAEAAHSKSSGDDLLSDYAAQMAAAQQTDARRSQGPQQHQPKAAKSGYEKILNALEKMFPNYSRVEISKFVQDFRNSRAQSLSGLALSDIVHQVTESILRDQQAQSKLGMQLHSPSAVNPVGEEIFQEEEDPCIICHEDLPVSKRGVQLWSCESCSHTYHLNCMRMWLKEQSTCPTCRMHVLLNDEFPALG